jgi:CBS domain-containing protein
MEGIDMSDFPTVRQYMDPSDRALRAETPIREAVRFLLTEGMTGAPVTEDGVVVGILSEFDCLHLLTHGDAPATGTVADFMTRAVITATPDMDIYYAAGLLLRNTFRRLPVVAGGRLVGQLTRRDALRAIDLNLETPVPGWSDVLRPGADHGPDFTPQV